MAYFPTENRLGLSNFTTIDTTPAYRFGTIVRGEDSILGGGEFIYLLGVAALVVGNLVTYNDVTGVTTLSPAGTTAKGFPLAVAMSANVTTTAGSWFQIAGVASIKKTAVKCNPSVAIFLGGTTGRFFPTVTSGRQIMPAVTNNSATVASATSSVNVLIQRPFAQGQVV